MEHETEYFFSLTPDKILDAVETSGLRCTGRCLQLNSMENRVYEVEIDWESSGVPASNRFLIAKFYRPGRWTREQILEEHKFLLDLKDYDIPVISPQAFGDQETLFQLPDQNIYFALFDKAGGRSPQELNIEELQRLGRLLARVHNVGATSKSHHRIALTPETYGLKNLDYLNSKSLIPSHLFHSYNDIVREICDLSAPWFEDTDYQRIHGDCHYGNILWGTTGPFLVDFDDMVNGPCVQDLWLLVPGRDTLAQEQTDVLLTAYNSMREFDYNSLKLIEALRALRIVHFSAWIARRIKDPAFINAFPEFGNDRYWNEELAALQECLALLR